MRSKNMGKEYGTQWLSCTTRHVRIFAAYIDLKLPHSTKHRQIISLLYLILLTSLFGQMRLVTIAAYIDLKLPHSIKHRRISSLLYLILPTSLFGQMRLLTRLTLITKSSLRESKEKKNTDM